VVRYRWMLPLGSLCGVVVPFVMGKLLVWDPVRHARVYREEGRVLIQFTWVVRPWDWFGGWA